MKKFYFFIILSFLLVNLSFSQNNADSTAQEVVVNKIIFIPFKNTGDSDFNWVSRGLEYLVNNKIAVVSGLYAIDDETVRKAFKESGFSGGVLSEKLAAQIGKITHADIIVSGSYSDEKSRLNIRNVYHNATNGQTISDESLLASPKAITKVADKIVLQLMQFFGIPEDENRDILRNTNLTDNNEALENFIKGYLAIEKNPSDPEPAIEYFEEAIEDDSQFWEAYYNLGVLYFNDNKYKKALSIFDKLIKETPHFYKPYFGRGIIFEDQKNYTGALSDFKKVIEINPNDFRACLRLARVSRLVKNFDDARTYLDMVKNLSADYAPYYFENGNLLVDLGKPNVAIDQYRKAIELDPENITYHQGLGEAYYRARVYYNALYEFNEILKKQPNDPNANFMLGITIYKQAVLEEIIDAFLDILNETGEDSPERSEKIQRKIKVDSLKQQKVYTQMVDAFSKAAAARSDFMQAKFNLALTYLEMEKFDKAEKYFLETQAIAPDLIQAYTKLAEVYEKTDKRPLAIAQYKHAFYIDPSIYLKKPTLGPVHQYINVLEPFMDDLNRRLKSNPDDVEANITMAKVQIEQGNYSGAKNFLEKVLRLQPGNSEARSLSASLNN
ncbi:MAG: tetratricopeptide repeat protein [Calditrichae bacterium]|nr:tetratricopeptide repeat protein [Calditrichia bacterium]